MTGRAVVAGALAVNAVPHAVVGFAGGTCPTPFGGTGSGPLANLAWAGVNAVGAVALLVTAGPVRGDQRAIDDRRRAVQLGCTLMTAFAGVYELRAALRGRRRV